MCIYIYIYIRRHFSIICMCRETKPVCTFHIHPLMNESVHIYRDVVQASFQILQNENKDLQVAYIYRLYINIYVYIYIHIYIYQYVYIFVYISLC